MVNLKKEFNQKKLNFYIKHLDLLNIQELSLNPTIPLKLVELNKKYCWNWNHISKNNHINIEFILNNLSQKLNWSFLTVHPNILVKDILSHINLDWNIENISLNPNLSNEDILSNLNFDWVIHYLLNNPSINKTTILTLIEAKGMSNLDLLEYSNIYLNLDLNEPSKQIDFNSDFEIRKSLNVNLFESVTEMNNLDITKLSFYKFIIEEDLFIKKYFIKKIENWWFVLKSNPFHKIGNKFLTKKWEKQFNHLE